MWRIYEQRGGLDSMLVLVAAGNALVGGVQGSGRTSDWLKFENPEAPAVKREAEEE